MIESEREDLAKRLRRRLDEEIVNQRLFVTPRSRRALADALPAAIRRYRKQWEDGAIHPEARPATRICVVALLKQLEEMKRRLAHCADYQGQPSGRPLNIACLSLLKQMFFVVSTFMSLPWAQMPATDRQPETAGTGSGLSAADTLSFEETLLAETQRSE